MNSSFYTVASNATDATDLTEEDKSSLKLFRTTSGLKTHYKRLSNKLFRKRDSTSTQGSSVTLPIAGAGSLRKFDDDVDDFDISHLRSQFVDDGKPASSRAASVDAVRQDSAVAHVIGKDSNAGVEVLVEGGVALTEEAVETHIADVMTEV